MSDRDAFPIVQQPVLPSLPKPFPCLPVICDPAAPRCRRRFWPDRCDRSAPDQGDPRSRTGQGSRRKTYAIVLSGGSSDHRAVGRTGSKAGPNDRDAGNWPKSGLSGAARRAEVTQIVVTRRQALGRSTRFGCPCSLQRSPGHCPRERCRTLHPTIRWCACDAFGTGGRFSCAPDHHSLRCGLRSITTLSVPLAVSAMPETA